VTIMPKNSAPRALGSTDERHWEGEANGRRLRRGLWLVTKASTEWSAVSQTVPQTAYTLPDLP
jgi:hypothetical protein